MYKLNENIITLYSKWKEGYTRKENSFELKVRNFLSNRKDADKFKISEDGKHLDAYNHVTITDDDILDGKLPVPFGEIKGAFDCSCCPSLTSLEGAPKKIKGSFECYDCPSLKLLEGAPKKIGGIFDCSGCTSLTSLVGAPEYVGWGFDCRHCDSLTSLEGAPKKVGKDFNCCICSNLTSIEGLPKEIGGNLYIDDRFKGKIPNDITIKGDITYYG